MNEAEKAATWWYDAGLGGGAYLDYCCYGAALACWFFGKQPDFVFGVRTNLASRFGTADDTGILVMEFDIGVTIAEVTWNSVDLGAIWTGGVRLNRNAFAGSRVGKRTGPNQSW
ncbi:MAG: hypothetical protein M3069_04320 [Chloroflexota bacterium]|nr:hypothetical protein [Chloroflexota bacterium]